MFFSVMAIPALPSKRAIGKISFASTLYLCPVIDLLLVDIPEEFQAELRLGLQEALVNAAKHGNQLDPSKTVVVEFSSNHEGYWWTISDEGTVPLTSCCCRPRIEGYLPDDTSECGRGLFILQQVFDSVEWHPDKRQLRLGKKFATRG
jgi:serine/threonine-protein kinase RsbW